jgi:hypothetical protein
MSDDDTRRLDPDDDPNDDGESTRAFDPFAEDDGDDATTAMGSGDASTRRIASPVESHEPTATQRFGTTPVAADGPRTERIAVAAQRSVAGWMIALAILVALAIGVLIGYSQSDGSDAGVLVQRLVGTQGGVVAFETTGELVIPDRALPTATAITIRKVTNDNRIRLGAEGDPRSITYEPGELDMYVFEPPGLQFQKPIRISLPRPADGSALLVDAPDGPKVVGVEAEDDKVTFETSNFAFDDLR